MKKRVCLVSCLVVVVLAAAVTASADPPMGQVKWSQPPVPDGTTYQGMPVYLGWDDPSVYPMGGWQDLADDWRCTDKRPVTDIHWWGSYVGWLAPVPDPIRPIGFWFGIYADVPDPDPLDPNNWSYPDVDPSYPDPNDLLWSWQTSVWDEAFVGYDRDPLNGQILDSTFQYNVTIPEDELVPPAR